VNETLVNGFVQDQMTLGRRLRLTLGTKVERASATGVNVQPTARLWWSPDGNTALWAAISRAVRTPTHVERSVRYNIDVITDPALPLPGVAVLLPNPELQDEELAASEAGLRTTLWGRAALDVGAFVNRYRGLSVPAPLEPEPSFTAALGPHLLLPTTFRNALAARSIGAETVLVVPVTTAWSVTGTLDVFRISTPKEASSHPMSVLVGWARSPAALTPPVQWSVRSSLTAGAFDVDAAVGREGAAVDAGLPAHVRVDARVARRMGRLELSLNGHDVLHRSHYEVRMRDIFNPQPVGRAVSCRASWRWGRD
jgi:iron complex outermembrane receptor protein